MHCVSSLLPTELQLVGMPTRTHCSSKSHQSLKHRRWNRTSLLFHISVLDGSDDSDDEVRVVTLVQTRQHERESLGLLLRCPSTDDYIPDRIDEPDCESQERRRVSKDGEIGTFGEVGETVRTEGLDLFLVEDVGTLTDNGPMERHR